MTTTILSWIAGIAFIFCVTIFRFIYNCKEKTIIVGKKYRIRGENGLFRYVHKNVFRDCKTGRLLSVSYNKIREIGFFYKLTHKMY